MAKHTRGPWQVDPGHRTVEARASDGNLRCICDPVRGGSPAEADANARLIASAPRLLTALEWATRQIGILSEYIETPDAKLRYDECVAALSDATGDSSVWHGAAEGAPRPGGECGSEPRRAPISDTGLKEHPQGGEGPPAHTQIRTLQDRLHDNEGSPYMCQGCFHNVMDEAADAIDALVDAIRNSDNAHWTPAMRAAVNATAKP